MSQVMIALRSASQHDECLQCWRELVLLDGLGDIKIDTKTYSLALSSAAKAERWEEVEAIFDMMQVGGGDGGWEHVVCALVGGACCCRFRWRNTACLAVLLLDCCAVGYEILVDLREQRISKCLDDGWGLTDH